MMREDVTDAAAKMITLHRAGAGLGGESFLRAITGEPFSKDRKMTALSVDVPEGNAALFPSSQLPIWLKIERRGNGFTPYASTDGAFWIPVGRTQQIPMKSTISAGVFVAADTDGTLQSATFDGSVTDVTPRGASGRETPFAQSYRAEWTYFLAVMRGDVNAPPPRDQLALHRVLEAVYRSADEGRDVLL